MAITLAPTYIPTSSFHKNLSPEDFVNELDRVEPEGTPFLSYCDNEVKLGAVDRMWNVDAWPVRLGALGVGDGETVVNSATLNPVRNVASGVRKMGNVAQGFRKTFGAGWIAEELPGPQGMGDLISHGKADAYILLKQEMESAFCSLDQKAFYDLGPVSGAVCAGFARLVGSSGAVYSGNVYTATSGFLVGQAPSGISIASGAFVTGTIAANFSRSVVKSVMLALRRTVQSRKNYTLLCGLSLRQAVTDLTEPSTATTTAAATGTGAVVGVAATQIRVYQNAEMATEIGQTVDVIRTDFGKLMVVETRGLGYTSTTSGDVFVEPSGDRATIGIVGGVTGTFQEKASMGIIIAQGNQTKTWGITPNTTTLGLDGGGRTLDAKCLATWRIKNPSIAGILRFTS